MFAKFIPSLPCFIELDRLGCLRGVACSYEKSTFPVEIRVFLSGYIKTQKLQTENMQTSKNVSLTQQHSGACKEKRPNYGSILAFGQGKGDDEPETRLDMWQIWNTATQSCRRWRGDEESGSQAQAAGRFEQEGGIAGGEPARIGK
jgi:hypothetical protein